MRYFIDFQMHNREIIQGKKPTLIREARHLQINIEKNKDSISFLILF